MYARAVMTWHRGRAWSPTVVAIAILALAVGVIAVGLLMTAEASRRDLRDRFSARAALASGFASSYVDDVIARERANALARLAAPQVSRAEFEQVVGIMGYDAALLLDDHGRVIQVLPANPSIVGRDITPRYPHLRTAEGGRVAVSVVVKGAGAGTPVVGLAVPFSTSSGRRIFSVGLDVAGSALGVYLRDSLPYPGATSELVDPSGKLVASSRTGDWSTLRGADPQLASAVIGTREGSYSSATGKRQFVTQHPAGTPWTLINTVPESALYSPLSGPSQWVPWAGLLGFLGAAVYIVVLFSHLAASREALALTSETDALTGLANRRRFDRDLRHELVRATRSGLPVCVAMLDLDHFKRFNDTHGHPAGDALLLDAATAWHAQVREVDTLARYGGEEFMVLLPGCALADAPLIVERVRAATPAGTTASIGVAQWNGKEPGDELLARVDAALYTAKRDGRNRTVIDPSSDRVPWRQAAST